MNEIAIEQGHVTVRPNRNIVASMAGEFREELLSLIEEGATSMEIDLTNVTMVDSDGLGALIAAHTLLAKKDGKLCIFNASEDIREFFRMMRLDKRFVLKRA
ncbi:STAS domain-containing protein [Candidatus Pacearchaeota archaeon]|nr:STAS domain-containing protein [Candidatus Pacearchaeota archaeon]